MTSATQGWVFFCNNITQEECFRQSVVGSREKNLPRLKALKQGDPVLLYNYESGMLVGHFTATSEVGLGLVQGEWIERYPAQVALELVTRFSQPVPRQKLESIPNLNFSSKGYLTNLSIPIEVVQEILDIAEGRKESTGQPGSKEETDFRRKFPANFLCSDGHWVRSKAELLIDNWLYTRRPPIAHAYERRLPVPEEAYADFYVPLGDCYIEYWGLDTADYSERQRRKLELFDKYHFRIISLEDRDIEKLDDLLPGKLLEFFPEGYRFQ
ncbi:MAG: hypothetical protein ACE5IJ_11700 [Thermoplasmata archaeon]